MKKVTKGNCCINFRNPNVRIFLIIKTSDGLTELFYTNSKGKVSSFKVDISDEIREIMMNMFEYYGKQMASVGKMDEI